ncbi:MAG: DUF2249 domain-containing protein [Corynebacterium sp.]|uniref:DUF2249 domain-containing protein n=1 Tax=Corynebacterium sp. TaxID=1720 RepID=UPI0026DF65F7|nr:DUF2249 domain-containing protein [Corynebacterium sp.]MDO5670471.1 DUF2249 domain-containing protein [Corynebacterium sp.]
MDLELPLIPHQPTPDPILIAAAIPHRLRHGAIHGALGTLDVGESMILVAPHNPLPLLAEIDERAETFDISYLTEGPDTWRLRLARTS